MKKSLNTDVSVQEEFSRQRNYLEGKIRKYTAELNELNGRGSIANQKLMKENLTLLEEINKSHGIGDYKSGRANK